MQALNGLFTSICDPRQQSKVRYNLSEMLTVAVLVCLCGADNCCEIVEWGKDRLVWLKQYLSLEHGTLHMILTVKYSPVLMLNSLLSVLVNGHTIYCPYLKLKVLSLLMVRPVVEPKANTNLPYI